MPKKIITPEETTEPTYTNEELHKQSIKEIASTTEIPEKVEKVDEEEPEIPLEEVGKKIAHDTARALLDEQDARAKAMKEQELADEKAKIEAQRTPEKEYEEIRDKFEKEQGRTPTWNELAVKIEERTLERLEKKQREAQEQAAKEQKTLQEQQEATNKQLNAVIDDELADLYKAGKLTKIKDINNLQDPGVIERRELFRQWNDVNIARKAAGQPEIISPTRMYEFYFKKPNTQPKGADAPVFGNKGSSEIPSDAQKINYARDIAGKRWSFFRKGR
jgi:hypothetical protein